MRNWLRHRRTKGAGPAYAALCATAALLLLLMLAAVLYPHDSLVLSPTPAAGELQPAYNLTASQSRLVEHYNVLPAVAAAVPERNAALLYEKLEYATRMHRDSARLLVIHVQNGLGNRLRALSSGLSMARATRRVPLIVWEADAHLGARFDDVLLPRAPNVAQSRDPATILYSDLVVIDSFPQWGAISQRTEHWRPFNYMVKDGPKARQGETLFWLSATVKCARTWHPRIIPCRRQADTIDRRSHVYFKSAYVAESFPHHLSYSKRVNSEMRALRPVPEVLDIVARHWPTGVKHVFGAHIRSRLVARDGVALNNKCEYSASAEEMTDYWRAQSSVKEFTNLLHYLMSRYKTLHFFIAADDTDALKDAVTLFPDRVHFIPRNCDDRNPACVRYAFADLLSLARCGRIYGSNWSSFTEAAGRLGNRRPWLSGVHFGKMRGRLHRTYTFRRFMRTIRFAFARSFVRCDAKS